MGVAQSLSSLGRILGPAWGGFICNALGLRWPFLTGGLLMVLAFVLSLRNLAEKQKLLGPAAMTRIQERADTF